MTTAVIVGGCATSDRPPAEALPANYRAIIIAKVKETFFDPYSIRDSAISQPLAATSMLGPAQRICVRANAKNRMGGYIGIKTTGFRFRAGQLEGVETEYTDFGCQGAVYEPFPEIEAGAAPPPAARR